VIKGQPPAPVMTVADRMKHYHVPGVSVAFIDRGQISWTRTYGFADVATKTPVTRETLFQAASISKPLSALAMLRLVEDGKLNLDEDVNVKLRAWKVPENEFTKEQKVTLRRIVSHSAGLTVHGFPGYASEETVPSIIQILNGEKPANTAPIRGDTVPGTLWRYSGGGHVVMQLLLTEVTGKPFPANSARPGFAARRNEPQHVRPAAAEEPHGGRVDSLSIQRRSCQRRPAYVSGDGSYGTVDDSF